MKKKLDLGHFLYENIIISFEDMPPLQKQGLGQQQSTDATCHVPRATCVGKVKHVP